MSEDRLTQECFLWFHNTYPQFRGLLFHVPNGGARNAREGAKFKSMGVWPGVSDFLFIWGGKIHCIELKTEDGTQSQAQRDWNYLVVEHGASYYLVRILAEFIDVIQKIMISDL